MPRCGLADEDKACGYRCHIGVANSVAVHRRAVEGRLGQAGRNRCCKNAAVGLQQRDGLGGRRLDAGNDARQGVGNGKQRHDVTPSRAVRR